MNPTTNQVIQSGSGVLRYVGTLSLSTSVATLSLTAGRVYLLQTDSDGYFSTASTSAGVVIKQDGTTATLTTTLGLKIGADSAWSFTAAKGDSYVSGVLASGTGSAKVWEIR